MAASVFTIKYDFIPEEPTELGVRAGELVRAPEDAFGSKEPWTLVETVAPPFNRGFVPTSYLIPYQQQQQQQQQHQQQQQQQGVNMTPPPSSSSMMNPNSNSNNNTLFQGGMGSGPRVRRLSDPRLPHQLLDALSINPPEFHEPPSAEMQQYELALRPFQTEHANIFNVHDRFMQQIMYQRGEQTRVLDEMATDITHRLEATKTKAADIATSMVEINAVIEAERKRWKEKLTADANAAVSSTF
jgi:hypothetical protein